MNSSPTLRKRYISPRYYYYIQYAFVFATPIDTWLFRYTGIDQWNIKIIYLTLNDPQWPRGYKWKQCHDGLRCRNPHYITKYENLSSFLNDFQECFIVSIFYFQHGNSRISDNSSVEKCAIMNIIFIFETKTLLTKTSSFEKRQLLRHYRSIFHSL